MIVSAGMSAKQLASDKTSLDLTTEKQQLSSPRVKNTVTIFMIMYEEAFTLANRIHAINIFWKENTKTVTWL